MKDKLSLTFALFDGRKPRQCSIGWLSILEKKYIELISRITF